MKPKHELKIVFTNKKDKAKIEKKIEEMLYYCDDFISQQIRVV